MLFDAREQTRSMSNFIIVIDHSCVIILKEIPKSSVMNTTPADLRYFDFSAFEAVMWELPALN